MCSNSLNFNDALFLLHEKREGDAEAVPLGKGSMIAILGTKVDEIREIISSIDNGICEVANDNAEGQIIISGNIESINSLKQILKEKKLNQFL